MWEKTIICNISVEFSLKVDKHQVGDPFSERSQWLSPHCNFSPKFFGFLVNSVGDSRPAF
jgi:hypothetical protein